jgi:hydroxymethylpyrimidine/phosphomethylpyrimidine kinase
VSCLFGSKSICNDPQLRSVLDDIDVTAIKTGMLANADVVRAVARSLKALPSPQRPLVIDPVCVSTSGHTLLEHDALGALITELLPLATVLTPNVSEAALLLQYQLQHHTHRASHYAGLVDATGQLRIIASIEDMLRASRALGSLGPRAVLLKGGHVARDAMRLSDVEAAAGGALVDHLRIDRVEYDGLMPRDANMGILFHAAGVEDPAIGHDGETDVPVVVDVLYEPGVRGSEGVEGRETRFTLFVRPYLDSTSTHGTGCTLGAALACALARGRSRTLFFSFLFFSFLTLTPRLPYSIFCFFLTFTLPRHTM